MMPAIINDRKERPHGAEAPEPGLSPTLARELDAIEQGIRAREEAQKRPAPTTERAPRPYAYD